ncbi:hypothetical protein OG599_09035 [Streptomyces sp. NBC_01335]|uniref:hypothetical protein n=1 Tax=Streptomyces sp. NBC_01335 TaxID=2903828 RepID=UPI002E13B1EF|nr:hypothetical protein OG599_09035 [Streptomyces sp. NBC_01335]
MSYSEKAIANGWGWVLGVHGQECRVERPAGPGSRRRRVEPTAQTVNIARLLGDIARALGLELPSHDSAADHVEFIFDAIGRLPGEQRIALHAVLLALCSEAGGQ